jgi:excisionase family DNA binding protein
MNQSPILTKREASEYLRCTERHIDRLRQAGRLQTVKLAGSTKAVRFRREAVEALAR